MEAWDLYQQLTEEYADLDCNEQWSAFMAGVADAEDEWLYTDVAGFVSIAVFMKLHFRDWARLPFGTHHKAFFDAIPRSERGKKVNILAPRGSAKSTCMAVVYPLHCIYYAYLYEAFGWFSEKYILILSRSYGNAMDRIKDIKMLIETRPSLQHLQGKEVWGEKRSITANNILLVPQSRGGKVRGSLHKGYRPSLVVPDDWDDVDAIRNPNILEKDEEWFKTDLMECGDENTNFISIDTVKGERALANQLRYNPAWENHFIQAIPNPDDLNHPISEHRWKEYRRLFTDLTVEPRLRASQCEDYYGLHESEMTAGVVETWVDKWSYRSIREKEFENGRGAVLREYQNYPLDREMAIFDMENAIRFTIEDEGLKRSDDRLVQWGHIAGASVFLDWSGIKESLENCYAAVVVVLWEPVERTALDLNAPPALGYVFKVWMGRGSRALQIEALCDSYLDAFKFLRLRLHSEFKMNLFCEDFVDTTGDIKENFQRHYRTVSMAKEMDTPLRFLPRHRDKNERIAGLEAHIENGWLAFGTDLPEVFEQQMREFPVCDFNDGPDALEGAYAVKVKTTEQETQRRRAAANRRVAQSQILDY